MDTPTLAVSLLQRVHALYPQRYLSQLSPGAEMFCERVYQPAPLVVELAIERIRRLEMLARLLFEDREEKHA